LKEIKKKRPIFTENKFYIFKIRVLRDATER